MFSYKIRGTNLRIPADVVKTLKEIFSDVMEIYSYFLIYFSRIINKFDMKFQFHYCRHIFLL